MPGLTRSPNYLYASHDGYGVWTVTSASGRWYRVYTDRNPIRIINRHSQCIKVGGSVGQEVKRAVSRAHL